MPVVRGLFCDVGLTVGSGVIVCVVGSGVALPPGRSIVERLRDELGITSFMLGTPGELDPVLTRLAGT